MEFIGCSWQLANAAAVQGGGGAEADLSQDIYYCQELCAGGSLGDLVRRQMIRPYKRLYRCPPPARAGVPLAWALAWAQAYLGF